jgi:hypothetical protein
MGAFATKKGEIYDIKANCMGKSVVYLSTYIQLEIRTSALSGIDVHNDPIVNMSFKKDMFMPQLLLKSGKVAVYNRTTHGWVAHDMNDSQKRIRFNLGAANKPVVDNKAKELLKELWDKTHFRSDGLITVPKTIMKKVENFLMQ